MSRKGVGTLVVWPAYVGQFLGGEGHVLQTLITVGGRRTHIVSALLLVCFAMYCDCLETDFVE